MPSSRVTSSSEALKPHPWDDSVKSLVSFPQVLAMMSEKLDWTQKLGDAFLAQQQDVMAAVQRLRAKAQRRATSRRRPSRRSLGGAGPAAAAATPAQTWSSSRRRLVVQQPATTVITIEPTNPQVVYVPTYNPAVVYGGWPYPAYPPYALLPARLRRGHSAPVVRRRHGGGGFPVG